MEAGVQGRKVNREELKFDSLPEATAQVLMRLAEVDFFKPKEWYLAGGTALALQAGHRQSVDLDFFTERSEFDEFKLERGLASLGGHTTLREKGTIYNELQQVQVSFIAYPFFHPRGRHLLFKNIRILPEEDIASMKIIAVSQRGRKRDFVDLYWYCSRQKNDLMMVIQSALKQYPQEHNLPHILKSLVYFEDAENDPMPNISFKTSWPEIKDYFNLQVPQISKEMLSI